MTTLLSIRAIQIKRELKNAGWRVIIVSICFLSFVVSCYTNYQLAPQAYYITAALFLFCLSIQLRRKDKLFVYNHIENPFFQFYLEYFVLTFPFVIFSLLTPYWFCYPILLISLLALPFLKYTFKQKTHYKKISAIIPAYNFEWIGGFRKYSRNLIPLYILAIGFSWFKFVPLIFLWLIAVTASSFYSECEPLHILREGNTNASTFLKQKLYTNSKLMFLFFAPVLIINIIFNPEFWWITLSLYLNLAVLLCFAVCFKYVGYEPNSDLQGNKYIISLISVCAAIPILLPVVVVPLVMLIIYYRKAIRNLKFYFEENSPEKLQ